MSTSVVYNLFKKMKKLTFKQLYAIIVLVVFVVYGWLYLNENRYKHLHDGGLVFDTWTHKCYMVEKFIVMDE